MQYKLVRGENPELTGIVVLSHGPMATAALTSASIIAGEIENCAALTIDPGDDPAAFGEKLAEICESFPKALYLVDIMAGTPFNQACLTAKKRGEKLLIATGVNVPMLLEVLSNREQTTPEALLELAVAAGKTGITNVTEWMSQVMKNSE